MCIRIYVWRHSGCKLSAAAHSHFWVYYHEDLEHLISYLAWAVKESHTTETLIFLLYSIFRICQTHFYISSSESDHRKFPVANKFRYQRNQHLPVKSTVCSIEIHMSWRKSTVMDFQSLPPHNKSILLISRNQNWTLMSI